MYPRDRKLNLFKVFTQHVGTAMSNMRLLTLLFFAITYASSAFAADKIHPLVSFKCSPEADIVTLTNSLLRNEDAATFKYSDAEGTFSPWDLVEIDHSTERTRIVKTQKITKTCKLSSGDYTITLEPQIFSRNLKGVCGESISSAFTVSYDGIDIQERTPFEDFCRGNSPIITRVTVFGNTREIKIKRIPRFKFY